MVQTSASAQLPYWFYALDGHTALSKLSEPGSFFGQYFVLFPSLEVPRRYSVHIAHCLIPLTPYQERDQLYKLKAKRLLFCLIRPHWPRGREQPLTRLEPWKRIVYCINCTLYRERKGKKEKQQCPRTEYGARTGILRQKGKGLRVLHISTPDHPCTLPDSLAPHAPSSSHWLILLVPPRQINGLAQSISLRALENQKPKKNNLMYSHSQPNPSA